MDLIIRNSRLRNISEIIDIGIANGVIVEIKNNIAEHGSRELDANGNLTTPTFVNAHEHLDDAMIGDSVSPNRSGTLQEAIEILREAKKKFTIENVSERAIRAIHLLVDNGTTIIRSHANVDSITQLTSVKGLVKAKELCSDLVTLQIVAFPQEGIIRNPGSEELLRKSMQLGADVVGGMPSNEDTEEDSKKHVDIVFDIAEEFGTAIDMHIDENCDPNSRTLHYFAAKAIKQQHRKGMTASHACALASYDDYYASRVIALVKGAGINVIANPCTNLMLQGRLDKQPIRRGVTRVKELNAAGVNVACGQDGINDPFDPLSGKCDMLQIAWIMGHASQLSTPSEVELLFDMITKNAAKALEIRSYGLNVGGKANMNILNTRDIYEAIRMQPERLYVIRDSNVVAGTKASSS